MSDTTRYVQPGWGPGHLNWPADGRFCRGPAFKGQPFDQMKTRPILTKKDQTRDRHDGPSRMSRNHRFQKGQKNSFYNLLRKQEDLIIREHLEVA